MKRKFFSAIIILGVLIIQNRTFGQHVSFRDSTYFEVENSDLTSEVDVALTYTNTSIKNYEWKEIETSLPATWIIYSVCTPGGCSQATSGSFPMDKDYRDNNFKVTFQMNNKSGIGKAKYLIYDPTDSANTATKLTVVLKYTNKTVSVKNTIDVASVKVNKAESIVTIENVENISKLESFDINGKLLTYSNTNTINIPSNYNGVTFIVMTNSEGNKFNTKIAW